MKIYGKIMDLIADAIKWIVTVILVFMVAVTFIEVIRRYAFGLSFSWADECIRFLIMWVTFLGGAAAFHKKKLVCFDLVTSSLSKKMQTVLELFVYIVLLVVIAALIYYTGKAATAPSVTKAVGTGFKVSMIWAYLPMPVGFAIMELFCINWIINLIAILKKGESDK